MAVNRVTRTGPHKSIRLWLIRWGSALPGAFLGALVLLLIALAWLPAGFGPTSVLLLGALGCAAVLRRMAPASSSTSVVQWTADADPVVLSLAAVALLAWAMGRSGAAVFPVTLLVVTWAGAAQTRRALGIAITYAVALELSRYVGRGAWSGELGDVLFHGAFILAFGGVGRLLLAGEVARVRQSARAETERARAAAESDARALGLETIDAEPVDLASRIDGMRSSVGRVLQILRRAAGAHTAVLMTRDDSWSHLRILATATPETDLLNDRPCPVKEGFLAVLTHLEADECDEEPVLRVSPLDGKPLPYYTRTPARIKSLAAVTLRSDDGRILGALLLDRTAGPAFGDLEVALCRNAAALLAQMLSTERALLSVEHRSGRLRHLLDANRSMTRAFGPARMYDAILDAARNLAPLRFGALLVRDPNGGRTRVIAATGEGATECIGAVVDPDTSLAAMVLKTPTVIPPARIWHPAHGALLGVEAGPRLEHGDPVVAIPLSAGGDRPIGGLVLVGAQPFDDDTAGTLELLASQAAVSVEHAAALAELEDRATTDALTHLDNRATVLTKLDQTLARAGRSGQSVASLLLDLDYFKQVNDTHGHAAGDMVLRQVAKTLEDSKRLNDSVGRLGGEEFLTVLEDTGEAGARLVAERIRTRIAGLTFPSQAGTFRVTASIGIAISPRDGEQKEGLLKKADRALYQAKDAGRDQVACHGDPHPAQSPSVQAIPA